MVVFNFICDYYSTACKFNSFWYFWRCNRARDPQIYLNILRYFAINALSKNFMKYVLLTRSAKENTRLEQRLAKRSILSLQLPLIRLSPITCKIKNYGLIIITSKFAAKIASKKIKHKAAVLVVGQMSASILSKNPYIKVLKIFDNAQELKDFLDKMQISEPILYLSGNIIKAQMPNFVERQIIYKVRYRINLSTKFKRKLPKIKIIMLYSENSAKTFINLCEKNGIIKCVENIIFITLNNNIKKFLQGCKVIACKKPLEEKMLELLYRVYE